MSCSPHLNSADSLTPLILDNSEMLVLIYWLVIYRPPELRAYGAFDNVHSFHTSLGGNAFIYAPR